MEERRKRGREYSREVDGKRQMEERRQMGREYSREVDGKRQMC
jgi:hypothetical protein